MFNFPELLLLRTAFFILAFGLPMIFTPKAFKTIMEKTLKNLDIMRIRAFLTLIIGFLFLSVYQKFDQGWAMTFSIFGYVSLLKGLVLLRYPTRGQTKYKIFLFSKAALLLWGIVVILFAAFFARIALAKL